MYPHWEKQPESEIDWFQALAALARYLRSPDGCPWDREQTAARFAAFAREEADEYLEAFEKGDKMAEELDYIPMPDSVVKQIEKTWSAEIKS